MRIITLSLSLLLAAFHVPHARPVVRLQAIPLSEVSGAVNIGGDRVVLVADEGYQVRVVSSAEETFKAGDAASFDHSMRPAASQTDGAKGVVDDIEDVAWDASRQAVFVLTSHSRSRKQDKVPDARADKPQRHKLARLLLNDGVGESTHQEVDILEEALRQFPFVKEAMQRPHEAGGDHGTFNAEGLAFDKKTGELLIGLRSPTLRHQGKPCAVVLRLKNPHELFDDKSALPRFDPEPVYLDLGGLGIRCMTYDLKRNGFWVVAGNSADPDAVTDLPHSALWFWKPSDREQPLRRTQADLLGLNNVEGVCLLKRDGESGLLLLSDDGDGAESRYLWLPTPKLVRAE
jgi:hypothetical protein